MILVIDNYDSFTYNLVQYIGEMTPNLEVHRNDRISLEDIARRAPSHLILSAGAGLPEAAGICLQAVQSFLGRIPILGIGLGLHVIATTFGSQIIRAHHPQLGRSNEICHDGRTIFHTLEYRFRATCYHTLTVDRDLIPPCLEVSATTPDGVIMGLRHRQYICEGIQFHPESVMTAPGKMLIRNFLTLPQQT
ncbi:MAG: aminodeoxychorismate/anthranilate synthase component II [Blastocatellia bacterium]|nr:aminodeoxychorismate/anthranilate synthase component II [Blastocatellia bacterium]